MRRWCSIWTSRTAVAGEPELRGAGSTVARTVAGTPDELKRYFSRASFKDGRLAVTSSGAYSEADPAQDVFKLGWNVDLDLPVKRDVRR